MNGLLAAALVAALLAGCTQGEGGDSATAPTETVLPPPGPKPQPAYDIPFEGPFAVDAAGGSQQTSEPADVNLVQPVTGLFFDVPDATTGIDANASWACSSPTCTFRFVLVHPDGQEVVDATASGHAELAVDEPAAGRWLAVLRVDGAATQATGTIHVVLHMPATP